MGANRAIMCGYGLLVAAVVVAATSGALGQEQRGLPEHGAVVNSPRSWGPQDLLVDPLGDPYEMARRLHKGVSGGGVGGAAAGGGGTMDIGEIAVLEDDGTLVVNGETRSNNIVNAFYATHNDDYDQVAIHVASSFPGNVDPEGGGFAFFSLVAGFAGGINRFQGNPSESSGFTRLTGFCNMNDLPAWPANPTADFFGGVASYVEIMGQEMGHAWGAFVQPSPATGADIIGRQNAHWSFFLHHPGVNNASPLEGNQWEDEGGGTFTTVASFTGLAELDEYVMGLRAPEAMAPFWVIDFPGGPPFADSRFPSPGVTVDNGNRIDLTIGNIIANNGPRGPSTATSMKTIRIAYILVIPQGTTAAQSDLDKINSFRLAWETYFNTETSGLGTMDTTLGLPPAVDRAVFLAPDDFESGTFDLSRYEWIQGATISVLGLNEPSGIRSLRLNGNWGGGDEVRSVPINLSDLPPVSLTLNYFVQRTGDGDSPESGDDLLVEYFNNAGDWVVLRTFLGNGADESVYTSFSDIVPADGLHGAFRFRFHRLQGGVGDIDDYFVDDISLTQADCNSNGIPDLEDIADGTSPDCNGNSIPDECEPDCDNDGTPDPCEIIADPSLDCDLNGVIDSCEIAGDPNLDCNANGALDSCDIASGSSLDVNGNGVPDDCECLADLSGNGAVDVPDLLLLLAVWGLDPNGPPDLDGDGVVAVPDLLKLLAAWGPCP